MNECKLSFSKKIIVIFVMIFSIEGTSLMASPSPQRAMNRNDHSGFSVMIVGSGSPRYNPQRSGPSALIRYNDKCFLVDMGNGTQARLYKAGIPPGTMNALMVTHHHVDHNEELFPIFLHNLLRGHSFLVTGPKKTKEFVNTLTALYREDINYRKSRRSMRQNRDMSSGNRDQYEIKELKGGDNFVYNGVKISTASMNHTITTIAYRFDVGSQSIVVSGDTAYTPNLGTLAKGADILVIDSGGVIRKNNRRNRMGNRMRRQGKQPGRTFRPTANRNQRSNRIKAHGTLKEVAIMAAESGVKKLVLTHFGPGVVDEEATWAEIRKTYKGEIIFAHDLMTIKL